MNPAIPFKSISAITARRKYEVIISLIADLLSVCDTVIIIQITVITGRTYKLFIEDWDEIIINIHVLVHPTKEFNNAFILDPIGIGSLDYFPTLKRLLLVIIIGNGFSQISRQEFYTCRTIYILVNQISNRAKRLEP